MSPDSYLVAVRQALDDYRFREASIALGDKTEVLCWMRKYVRHPRADAFEIGSILRQVFTRQWQPFAIHHRSRETLQVNEGVLFTPIKHRVSTIR
jgi:hypothetical protein